MTAITQSIFKNDDLGIDLAVYGSVEEPWFKAKDIATYLEYKNPCEAVRNFTTKDEVITGSELFGGAKISPETGSGRNQKNTRYINESGMYSLIIASKMEKAVAFRKWITRTVLPAIRKRGCYEIPQLPPPQETSLDRARAIEIRANSAIKRAEWLMEHGDDRDTLQAVAIVRSFDKLQITENPDDEEFSLSRRLDEVFGLRGTRINKALSRLGRIVAREFRTIYGTEPSKRTQWVDGASRSVFHYTTKHFVRFIDGIITREYGRELDISSSSCSSSD